MKVKGLASLGTVFIVGCHLMSTKDVSDLHDHELRQSTYWDRFRWQNRPLSERVAAAFPELIEYLRLDNKIQGYPSVPKSYEPPPALKKAVVEAVRNVPREVQELVKTKIAGVYFVEDLGGTAYTEHVYAPDGSPAFGFIVVDKMVFDRPANEWATWRENTAFRSDDSGVSVSMRIADEQHDTPVHAFQFVFLHELAHIVAVDPSLHPRWDLKDITSAPPRDFRFSRHSWTIHSKKYASLFDHDYPMRKEIAFYRGEDRRQPLATALQTYHLLAEITNFPSLYGVTQPAEDFAESFATYVHAVMLGRPYQVTVTKEGSPVFTYRHCWEEKRCQAKRLEIESILGIGGHRKGSGSCGNNKLC